MAKTMTLKRAVEGGLLLSLESQHVFQNLLLWYFTRLGKH